MGLPIRSRLLVAAGDCIQRSSHQFRRNNILGFQDSCQPITISGTRIHVLSWKDRELGGNC